MSTAPQKTFHTFDQCIFQLFMTGNALVVASTSGDTAKVLRCTPGELIGKSFVDFVHCEDKALVSATVQRLRHGEYTIRNEYRFVNPQREIIWVDVSMTRSQQGTLEITLLPVVEYTNDFKFGMQ